MLSYNRWVEVDLDIIAANYRAMREFLPCQVAIMAVVKNDAYGHGAVEVAKVAEEVGAAGFCVAVLDEGLQLRHADIVKPILVLGVVSPKYAPIAAVNNISLTVPNFEWLKEAEKYIAKENLQ